MKKYFLIGSLILIFGLAACSNEPEVKTLPSGLKYLEERIGDGREAKEGDLVTIQVQGWIVKDSTDLFSDWTSDSTKHAYKILDTYSFGKEIKFVLGKDSFIKGSDEGIIGMKAGGVRSIIIPSETAYGKTGMGPIPPNTDIKLVVELIKVQDQIVAKMWDVDTTKYKTTESGLKYVIVKEGEGPNVEDGNVVVVHYSGYLTDGTKFDSSVERDDPFRFVVGSKQVIPGWDEGVKLGKKGSKLRLVVPPELGYGGMQIEKIPPNSTLIFDIEILDVK